MTKQLRSLLFEAYRRNDMADEHERSKQPTQRWLGLGTAAAYRPALSAGLMVFHDGKTPPPRCMGWLRLTEAGLDVLRGSEVEFAGILRQLKGMPAYQQSYQSQFTLAGGLSA